MLIKRFAVVAALLGVACPLVAQEVGGGRGGAEKPVQVEAEPAQPVERPKEQAVPKPAAEAAEKKEVDAELARKAEAEIVRLGDDDFQTRRDAYAKLQKMGEAILPVLKKHEHHKDLETRNSVRSLIGDLEQTAEAADNPHVRKIDARIAALDKAAADLKAQVKAGGADAEKAKAKLAALEVEKAKLQRVRQMMLRKINAENHGPQIQVRPLPAPMPRPVPAERLKKRGAPGRPVEKKVEDKDGALNEKQLKQAEDLVAKLGSEDFDVRETATEKLEKMGKPVLPVLKKHTDAKDAEVRTRVAALIKKIEGGEKDAAAGGAQVIVNGRVIQLQNGQEEFEGELPGGGMFKVQMRVEQNVKPAVPEKKKAAPEEAPKPKDAK